METGRLGRKKEITEASRSNRSKKAGGGGKKWVKGDYWKKKRGLILTSSCNRERSGCSKKETKGEMQANLPTFEC